MYVLYPRMLIFFFWTVFFIKKNKHLWTLEATIFVEGFMGITGELVAKQRQMALQRHALLKGCNDSSSKKFGFIPNFAFIFFAKPGGKSMGEIQKIQGG